MLSDHETAIWPLKPHTAAKHQILRQYLAGWFPILGQTRSRILFLDGFAGPGIYAGGEPGSPVVALQVLLDHGYLERLSTCEFIFLFNERDHARYESLVKVEKALREGRGGYPKNVKVELHSQPFSDLVASVLTQLEDQKANLAPTFAFVDPFGYKDVDMQQIADLLTYNGCELFIYFDFNSVQRFSTSGVVDDAFRRLFGTDEFASAPSSGDPTRGPFLADLYERQLKDVARFTFVQRFRMTGENGLTICYLFYCTRNIKGLKVMKKAMWSVAPEGDYGFSDRFAGQDVLFGPDPDMRPLREALLREFTGKRVTIEQVEDFTVIHTPYHDSHLKRATLAPMQREGLINSPNQNRKNTYPAGTLIDFP